MSDHKTVETKKATYACNVSLAAWQHQISLELSKHANFTSLFRAVPLTFTRFPRSKSDDTSLNSITSEPRYTLRQRFL